MAAILRGGRRDPVVDRRLRAGGIRHRRGDLHAVRALPAASARRDAADAGRRADHGGVPADPDAAAAVAAGIRKFHDAGIRLLLAAWQHPGLRHRACAAGPRLGDGAAFGVVLSGTGGRPDRLWRGLRHYRKDAAADRGAIIIALVGYICSRTLQRAAPTFDRTSRSSRARDRARRPGPAPRRPWAACRPARTRRSACRRADTNSRRSAASAA